MLATLFNMPKWLVAIVTLCILSGYHQQVECKLTGCKSTVVAHFDKGDQDTDSVPQSEDEHCRCQCHSLTLTFCTLPSFHVSDLRAVCMPPVPWIENAPEAPCLDIEHPPQLA